MQKKYPFTLLLLSVLAALGLGFFILSVPPLTPLKINSFSFSPIPLFLFLFFLSVFGVFGFFLKSTLQGLLIGLFSVTLLTLRFFGFTHWFFLLVICLLFCVFELMIQQQR